MTTWHYAIGRDTHGPVDLTDLQTMAQDGRLRREDLVWNETLPAWTAAGTVSLLFGPSDPPPLPSAGTAGDGNRIVAALCGIFLGALGIHKFVLGFNTPGLIMLGVTVITCGIGGLLMGAIGFIEGVIYLTASDDSFHQRYVVEKREWF